MLQYDFQVETVGLLGEGAETVGFGGRGGHDKGYIKSELK